METINTPYDDAFRTLLQDCPELVQYLKERRLYTNAPVAAEEEVTQVRKWYCRVQMKSLSEIRMEKKRSGLRIPT